MSVYKAQREESHIEFLRVAQDIAVYTAQQVKKFPKAQRHIFANDIMRLGLEIHEDIMRANAIYLHKGISVEEYKLRKEYFIKARGAIFAMSSLLSVTLSFLLQGNNFFGSKESASKVFEHWAELLNKEAGLIKAIQSSDAERYKKYQQAKEKPD